MDVSLELVKENGASQDRGAGTATLWGNYSEEDLKDELKTGQGCKVI